LDVDLETPVSDVHDPLTDAGPEDLSDSEYLRNLGVEPKLKRALRRRLDRPVRHHRGGVLLRSAALP
jgi:hypothetical protein